MQSLLSSLGGVNSVLLLLRTKEDGIPSSVKATELAASVLAACAWSDANKEENFSSLCGKQVREAICAYGSTICWHILNPLSVRVRLDLLKAVAACVTLRDDMQSSEQSLEARNDSPCVVPANEAFPPAFFISVIQSAPDNMHVVNLACYSLAYVIQQPTFMANLGVIRKNADAHTYIHNEKNENSNTDTCCGGETLGAHTTESKKCIRGLEDPGALFEGVSVLAELVERTAHSVFFMHGTTHENSGESGDMSPGLQNENLHHDGLHVDAGGKEAGVEFEVLVSAVAALYGFLLHSDAAILERVPLSCVDTLMRAVVASVGNMHNVDMKGEGGVHFQHIAARCLLLLCTRSPHIKLWEMIPVTDLFRLLTCTCSTTQELATVVLADGFASLLAEKSQNSPGSFPENSTEGTSERSGSKIDRRNSASVTMNKSRWGGEVQPSTYTEKRPASSGRRRLSKQDSIKERGGEKSASRSSGSIAQALCGSGQLKTVCWLIHHKTKNVADAAQRILLVLSTSCPDGSWYVCSNWASSLVEQGCVPILLMTTSSGLPVLDPTFIERLRDSILGPELARLTQVVSAAGNIELRTNVACALVLLSSPTISSCVPEQKGKTRNKDGMQALTSSGALQSVISMLRVSSHRHSAIVFLKLVATLLRVEHGEFLEKEEKIIPPVVQNTSTGEADCVVVVRGVSGVEVVGVKMACPPATLLSQCSPSLGTAFESAQPGQLPLLRGKYDAWEEIMAHIGAPNNRVSNTSMLGEYVIMTSAHGFYDAADIYARELWSTRDITGNSSTLVSTAAYMLETGLKSRHAWLGLISFLWLIDNIDTQGDCLPARPLELNRLVNLIVNYLTELANTNVT